MNKTDMSNPAQYTAYLEAYVTQRRKDKLRHASRVREWRKRGKQKCGRGGAQKKHAGQDLHESGQLKHSPGYFESPQNS